MEFRAVPVRAAVSGITGAEMDCIRARLKELLRIFWSTFLRKKPYPVQRIINSFFMWRVLP
jgi:hypothetical protein